MNEKTEKILYKLFLKGIKETRKDIIDLTTHRDFILDDFQMRSLIIDLNKHFNVVGKIFNYHNLKQLSKPLYDFIIKDTSHVSISKTDIHGFLNISCLKNLTTIFINDCNLKSFDGLEKFPLLREIRIKNTNITAKEKFIGNAIQNGIDVKFTF